MTPVVIVLDVPMRVSQPLSICRIRSTLSTFPASLPVWEKTRRG